MTGSTLQIVVMLLLCAHFLHNCKKGSNNTVLSSFNNYGLFWGCVTVSFLGNVLLTAHGIIITHLHLTSGVPKLIAGGWITLAQLVFATIASLLIAIYYGRNLNFMIPFVFLLPFAILCCNHTKEAGKKIVSVNMEPTHVHSPCLQPCKLHVPSSARQTTSSHLHSACIHLCDLLPCSLSGYYIHFFQSQEAAAEEDKSPFCSD